MMAHRNLQNSLDDMINTSRMDYSVGRVNNVEFGPRSRRHGFSSFGAGPARCFPGRVHYRAAPYSASQMETWRVWQRSISTEEGDGGDEGKEAKLCISNLDSCVTNQDLVILFSELGELTDSSIHYDREGKSLGTAEVVYTRHEDAVAAWHRYNGVKLDGKPMIIGFVGVSFMTATPYVMSPVTLGVAPENSSISLGSASYNRHGERAGAGAKRRGPNHDGYGMRRTQKHQSKPVRKATVEELDAELDNYWVSSASRSGLEEAAT